jgi:uncharacterized peroxidase-related enzyme
VFLNRPEEDAEVVRLYEQDAADMGFVMNLTGLWAWRPEVMKAFTALRTLLTSKSSLTAREQAVIVSATVASIECAYCSLAWGTRLAGLAGVEAAAAVLQDQSPDALTGREAALAAWARKVVVDANATTRQDVEDLRCAGFSEREIFEATALIGFRIAFSKINDALGAQPDPQLAEAAPPQVRHSVNFGRPVGQHLP